jgi:hypothetical protein
MNSITEAPEYALSIGNDDSRNMRSLSVLSSQPEVNRWLQPFHAVGRLDPTLAYLGDSLFAMSADLGGQLYLGCLDNE